MSLVMIIRESACPKKQKDLITPNVIAEADNFCFHYKTFLCKQNRRKLFEEYLIHFVVKTVWEKHEADDFVITVGY